METAARIEPAFARLSPTIRQNAANCACADGSQLERLIHARLEVTRSFTGIEALVRQIIATTTSYFPSRAPMKTVSAGCGPLTLMP